MKIDHVFLRAKRNAPEADLLCKLGLVEGGGNRHPGQGTENRRFFFRNAFIEFLWVCDASEVNSDVTRPTMLYERLTDSSASPFGVCFRPATAESGVPFPTWNYSPKYMPDGMTIGIGSDVPLSEPMWFFLENGQAPDAAPEERRQLFEHPLGMRDITAVTITSPHEGKWSDAALAAVDAGSIILVHGEHHLMEITFDHGTSGQRHDFRPGMPLVFNY